MGLVDCAINCSGVNKLFKVVVTLARNGNGHKGLGHTLAFIHNNNNKDIHDDDDDSDERGQRLFFGGLGWRLIGQVSGQLKGLIIRGYRVPWTLFTFLDLLAPKRLTSLIFRDCIQVSDDVFDVDLWLDPLRRIVRWPHLTKLVFGFREAYDVDEEIHFTTWDALRTISDVIQCWQCGYGHNLEQQRYYFFDGEVLKNRGGDSSLTIELPDHSQWALCNACHNKGLPRGRERTWAFNVCDACGRGSKCVRFGCIGRMSLGLVDPTEIETLETCIQCKRRLCDSCALPCLGWPPPPLTTSLPASSVEGGEHAQEQQSRLHFFCHTCSVKCRLCGTHIDKTRMTYNGCPDCILQCQTCGFCVCSHCNTMAFGRVWSNGVMDNVMVECDDSDKSFQGRCKKCNCRECGPLQRCVGCHALVTPCGRHRDHGRVIPVRAPVVPLHERGPCLQCGDVYCDACKPLHAETCDGWSVRSLFFPTPSSSVCRKRKKS